MSILTSSYHLTNEDFQQRFKTIKKIDDLFCRGYVLANDNHTYRRAILKYYSIETPDQQQAVLENMANFEKLNQIEGICKLLAYAISANKTQLLSAFQYDPLSLGEFIQKVKQINLDKHRRVEIYLQMLQQTLKVISTSVQIGIQLDDINRQTIVLQQNSKHYQYDQEHFPSSSSIQPYNNESLYLCSILYDEREKEYNKIENNEHVMSSGNKLYWSSEKIENQVLKGRDYMTQYGQESVYQLGLLMLDVVYEVERYSRAAGSVQTIINGVNTEEDLKPDEVAAFSENRLSYYNVDKDHKIVTRNEILISHRLNYLISSDSESLKQFGALLKSMIVLLSQSRASLNKVINDNRKIRDILKKEIESTKQSLKQSDLIAKSEKDIDENTNKIETPNKYMLKKSNEPFKSLEDISEEPVYMSTSETMKNININTNNQISLEDIQVDSLKYSENSGSVNPIVQTSNNTSSLAFQHVNLSNGGENARISGNLTNIKGNQHQMNNGNVNLNNKNSNGGLSEGKLDSNKYLNNSTSQKLASKVISQLEEGKLNSQQLVNIMKNHHEQLRQSLNSALYELNQIRNQNPDIVLRKEYYDGSSYYGCIDLTTMKRLGLGVYIHKTGDLYFGVWKDNTLNNGTYLFKNGESFEGTVKGGKQGLGIYRYLNGNVYKGMWKDDLKNGKGLMAYPNGAKYDGEWLKGKKHGQGSYYYENGMQYHGGFNLGKKYGNGIFIFPNGTKLEGFWDNNHLQGFAKIYYNNGDYYEGNFHMSQKSGEGVYKWNGEEEREVQYKGQFKKDNLDGFAIVRFRNGQIYEGKVKNGKRFGQGSYKYSNGDEFKGEWKNDQKQIGKYIFNTGDQFEGRFKNGQMAFGTLKYSNGQVYQGEFQRGYRHGVGTYSNRVGQIVHEGYWEKDEFIGNKKH